MPINTPGSCGRPHMHILKNERTAKSTKLKPSDLEIKAERQQDWPAVRVLTSEAFKNVPYASGDEANLVERLRQSPEYVPELSLIAWQRHEPIGHIMFTRLHINGTGPALTLAPLSIRPDHQRRGVGGYLIEAGHSLAAEMGFVASVLVGIPDYYPRFGYRPLSEFVFSIPFPAPPECCQAIELSVGGLSEAKGEAVFSKAFIV